MLILLPPSETKVAGGDGPPLDLAALGWPALTPTRARLVDELVILAKDPVAAREVLEISERQDDQVALDAALLTSPTMPALRRYTGVLYDALDVGSLRGAARTRARERILLSSALFGLLRADDPIPAYRLSGGTVLPEAGRLTGAWRASLRPVVADLCASDLVVDLRSGMYAALAPAPGAVAVRVLSERSDGTRSIVSHFNKATKGHLARALVSTGRTPRNVTGLCRLIIAAGFTAEKTSEHSLDVIVAA